MNDRTANISPKNKRSWVWVRVHESDVNFCLMECHIILHIQVEN
jgi:hypothetical protein